MSEHEEQFGRLITAMVTPFDQEGNLDTRQTINLARHLVDTGSEGIVVAGTTGESPTLTEHERRELLNTVLEAVGDHARIIAGTSTYSTGESVRLSRMAQAEGAHGLLLVTPYYNKPSQEGLYRHFAAIADSVTLPVILYNVPSRTNVNMLPETVRRLDESFGNIVGLKEAIGTSDEKGQRQVNLVIGGKSPGFEVWSGNDQDTLFFLRNGGYGVVSVASHLVGRSIRTMMDLQLSGQEEDAQREHHRLMPLFDTLFPPTAPEPSPASIKAMLNIAGMEVGGLRLPLVEVPETYRCYLQDLMSGYELAPARISA
ncbi:MAG: 4-hydroxy-tetrahydrodipicolinate synthase [Microgenomates group bacterium Gr01-1014_7]|nr:MAG: 4-hydroxy-tetrahydrodipicolinate synthase [Microgenomates group bacterium Gr01-1014_7]